jgi:hypothetical protein
MQINRRNERISTSDEASCFHFGTCHIALPQTQASTGQRSRLPRSNAVAPVGRLAYGQPTVVCQDFSSVHFSQFSQFCYTVHVARLVCLLHPVHHSHSTQLSSRSPYNTQSLSLFGTVLCLTGLVESLS